MGKYPRTSHFLIKIGTREMLGVPRETRVELKELSDHSWIDAGLMHFYAFEHNRPATWLAFLRDLTASRIAFDAHSIVRA